MKIRLISMKKYHMSKMPWRFYLPKIEKYWGGQIWQFSIFRDYKIEFDFRKGNLIDWLLTPKEKESFLMSWFSKRN